MHSTFWSESLNGKRSFGRPRHRWVAILIYLKETEWENVDWIHLAQDMGQWHALVNTVMKLHIP
jgi:hypothetical protein